MNRLLTQKTLQARDEAWSYGLKAPIYRVVNALDCVTMLPPGGTIMSILKFFLDDVPLVGPFLRGMQGYYHVGDERYLTNCSHGQYQNARLIYRVTLFRRLSIIVRARLGGVSAAKKFATDHSMAIYRKKLSFIAQRRNP